MGESGVNLTKCVWKLWPIVQYKCHGIRSKKVYINKPMVDQCEKPFFKVTHQSG